MAPSADDKKLYDKIKEVTSGQIKPEEQRKVNASIKKNVESTKSLAELLTEVNTLIEDRDRPRTRLQRVQYISNNQNLDTKLRADDCILKFDRLMSAARSIAGDGKASIEDLEETFPAMMADSKDPKEAISTIESIKQGVKSTKLVETLKEDFNKLGEQIESYISAVQQEIKDKTSAQAEKLAKLVKELKEINVQIDEINVNVMKPLMEFLKLGTGSFKDVAEGTPVVAYTALLTSVSSGLEKLVSFKEELDAADKKRKRLEDERKAKQREIEAVEVAQGKTSDTTFIPECLRSVHTDLKDLSPRIAGFLNINVELPRDLDALVESLEAIPDGVKLDDKKNERVQDYYEKESLVFTLQNINKRGLNKFLGLHRFMLL